MNTYFIFRILNFSRTALMWLFAFYAITFSLFYEANSTDLIAFTLYQWSICFAIKNLSNTTVRHALLIALSGYGRAEDKQKALDAGFDAHITKPFDVKQIREILNEPEKFRRR